MCYIYNIKYSVAVIVLTSKKDTIFIVPHTHWDREWYLPFQNFRTKLVKLIDSLIGICEKQDFRFMLDGQTIVLEEYLEIKPENKERLLKLIRDDKKYLCRPDANGEWYKINKDGLEYIPTISEIADDLAKYLKESPDKINEMIEFMTKKKLIKWATEDYYNSIEN